MALRQLPANSPIEDILLVLEEDGGLILKDFVSVEILQTIATELKPFEQPHQVWKGNFFPEATKRICGTVGKSKTLASQLLLHPVFREVFGNASTTFDIGPGADAQQLHRDDGVHHLSHPNKQPHMIGLLVAETRTTAENGATVLIPGSHKFGDWDDRHPKPEETIQACLDPGDALLFDGAVFHGGGANVTKSERRKVHGVFMIRGNLRPEENTYLSFPPEIAKEYPDEVLEAYGYRAGGSGLGWVEYQQPMAAVLGRKSRLEALSFDSVGVTMLAVSSLSTNVIFTSLFIYSWSLPTRLFATWASDELLKVMGWPVKTLT